MSIQAMSREGWRHVDFGAYYSLEVAPQRKGLRLAYSGNWTDVPLSAYGCIPEGTFSLFRRYGMLVRSFGRVELTQRIEADNLPIGENSLYQPLDKSDAEQLAQRRPEPSIAKTILPMRFYFGKWDIDVIQIRERSLMFLSARYGTLVYDATLRHAPLEKAIWALGKWR
jgi:hypothetical protein